MDLKGRNFLTLKDFTPEEITYLLDLSAELKEKKKNPVKLKVKKGTYYMELESYRYIGTYSIKWK